MPVARPGPRAAAFAVLVALSSLAQAQMMGSRGGNPMYKPGPGPDDLWDVTMRMEGMGMAMPAMTQQVCIKKGRGNEALVPKGDNECRVTDLKTSGNRTTFAMACSGDPPMTGTGDITSTPTSYNGRIAMKSTKRGEEMEMVQNFSGRKVGTCTDTSEQYVAKVESDARGQVAKACAESLDRLEPAMFESGGPCAAQRKAFCDKTASVARDMRDPAGHAAARQKYSGTLPRAFQSCGQDYAQVTQVACASAVQAKNWAFIGGGACDDDVRAHGPTYCNVGRNRSPDPQYAQLCARYATITRGTATASAAGEAPAAAAPPAPAAPDPLKQGVDAVRKLLPF